MLEYLHIRNLALIREAEMEFGPGLNILSGETGAGKSILLAAVGLALGGRADASVIRTGADTAYVELIFRIDDPELLKKLEDMDVVPEENRLILSRKIQPGKSRAAINGESVTAARLKEVSDLLIDIHGQHEHQSLLNEENHRAVLDAYAGKSIEETRKACASAYRAYKDKADEVRKMGGNDEERKREIDFLGFEIEEIENAGIRPGEEEELKKEHTLLAHGRILTETLGKIREALSGENTETLTEAIRASQDAVRFDERMNAFLSELMNIEALMQDLREEADSRITELEFSRERLQETEDRLDELSRLRRKYGATEEEILKRLQEFRKRKAALIRFDEDKESVLLELEAARKELIRAAKELHREREKAALRFSEEITASLTDLNFLRVQFAAEVQESRKYTAEGADDVRFLISLNPGEPLKPLSRVASGGEISRIMLAIKTMIADSDRIGTLVFDEIDSGISGKTAAAVSGKLSGIAELRQVICISHLPQIVSAADRHFLIEKSADDSSTVTDVILLDEESSIRELARLLGTGEFTEAELKNAREMKARKTSGSAL